MIHGTFQIEYLLKEPQISDKANSTLKRLQLSRTYYRDTMTVGGKWHYGHNGFQPLSNILRENFGELKLTHVAILIENAVLPWSRSDPRRDNKNYRQGFVHFIDSADRQLMETAELFQCGIECDRETQEVRLRFSTLFSGQAGPVAPITGVLFKLMTIIELTRKAQGVIKAFRKHLSPKLTKSEQGYIDRMIKVQFEEIGALL